jgi:hypothetical protein
VAREWVDLPRGWLVASLEIGRAHELKAWIAEAVQWGFDEPEDLSNNSKRVRWLRECRERAWSMLAEKADVPPVGKSQPADAKPKRDPARPKAPAASTSPPVRAAPPPVRDDVFLPNPNRRRRTPAPRPVKPDLCEISAAECNAFLASLPKPAPA